MPLIFGVTVGAFALIKLGTLTAWVAVMALALKLAVAVIFLLAGLLGLRHTNRL